MPPQAGISSAGYGRGNSMLNRDKRSNFFFSKKRLPARYLVGGLTVADWVVAYDAERGANLAASYINLAHPGMNDAVVGTAPTWSAGTGWTFNGSTQYLSTIPMLKTYSLAVKFSGYNGTGQLLGSFQNSSQAYSVSYAAPNMVVYCQASNCLNAPLMTSGVLIVNSRTNNGAMIYRNGIVDIEITGSGGTNPDVPGFIGCVHYPPIGGDGAFAFSASNIQFFGLLKPDLTVPEIQALTLSLNP